MSPSNATVWIKSPKARMALAGFSLVLAVVVALGHRSVGSHLASPASSSERSVVRAAFPPAGCSDGTWTATATLNAPLARRSHTAVWTGSEMIIWGGQDASG